MRNAQAHSTKAGSFEKRLRAYAAGAGAAAAGLLALSPPADAEVVVVPAHVTIGIDGYFLISIDGTTEFTLGYKFYSNYGWSGSLVVDATLGASVVGLSGQVVALKFGQAIGRQHQFEAGEQILAKASELRYRYNTWGPFANTYQRFLGLRFKLNGQVHYGWAGFSAVTASGRTKNVTGTLTAYAYETEPNTPIYAGQSSDSPRESRLLPANGSAPNTAKLQPATLGVLALGSLGLDAWRKRETGVQESS